MIIPPQFMSTRDAAMSLGLSVVTIRRAFREGRLTGVRLGSSEGWSYLMIDTDSIERYRQLHLGKRGPIPAGDPRREETDASTD